MDKNPKLHEIWSRPIYASLIQPPLTKKMILEAEKLIGFPLPKEYLELLQIQNGGAIRFSLKNTLHDKIFGIGPYGFSITDFSHSDDHVLKILADRGLFPFDAVGDGEYLCFEYNRRTKSPPKITYLSYSLNFSFTVAKSFSGYLKKLKIDTSGIWVIKTEKKLNHLINEISEKSKIIFENVNSSETYKYSENDYNVWIEPNKVSQSYTANKSVRIKGYKDYIEKEAVQFPETAKEYHILRCVNTVLANKIIKIIKKNDVEVATLRSILIKNKL